MNEIIAARDEILDRLRTAGLRVATDPRDVNPPCTIITPARFDMSIGGVYGGAFRLAFIAPDYGGDRVLDLLLNLAAKAAEVVPLGDSLRADVITLSGGVQLPALTTEIEV